MPKNFNIWPPNNPGVILRLAVVVLIVANLVAGYFVLWPYGGSPEELRQQAQDLRLQVRQRQGSLERSKKLVQKIEAGREEGDEFLSDYFLARRGAYTQILSELTTAANDAKRSPGSGWVSSQVIAIGFSPMWPL